MNSPDSPPIIIAGMHRSGTSLLTRALRRLGVFLGWRRDANDEARTFQEINKWLLLQAGGAWDYPPGGQAFDEPRARQLCTGFMRYATSSLWMSMYLGRPYWSTTREAPRFSGPWGWKDPRNTLTLPLWAQLYPDARVITVVRHGVDVAHSLVRRAQQRLLAMEENFSSRRRWFWLRLRKRRFETQLGRLPEAFALWQEYQRRGAVGAELFGPDFLSVRFEDLVSQPQDCLQRIVDHLQIDRSAKELAAAGAGAEPKRAFAYRQDETLRRFAASKREALQEWGYEP